MSNFSDKLKEATKASYLRTAPVMATLSDEGIAAYSGEETVVWTPDDSGRYRSTKGSLIGHYEDTDFSYVDDKKNIIINENQINLTQEDSSQYIPFEMFRYYDGIDLMSDKLGMEIVIFYVNRYGDYGESSPINVCYSDEKIRFGFVVPKEATLVSGKLKLEIQVRGASPLGGNYLLKTKPNEDIEILESLHGDGNIIVDESWATNVLEDVKQAALDAEAYAAQAKSSASQAENLNTQTKTTVNNVLDEVNTKIENASSDIAENVKNEIAETYYTKEDTKVYVSERLGTLVNREDVGGEELTVEEYVAQEISNADIEGKLTAYSTTEEVETMISNAIGDTGFEEDGITPVSVVDYVTAAVKSVDVTDQLGDTGTNEDGTQKTVVQYVNDAVAAVDISDQLTILEEKISDEYYDITEINQKLENISLDGYATEDYVGKQISPIKTSILNINETLEGIDKSPRATYDVEYGSIELEDGSTADNIFRFLETVEGETIVKRQFPLAGGGGSGSSVTMKIVYVDGYPQSIIKTVDDSVKIRYLFEGVDSAGDYVGGTASWKIGSKVVLTEEILSGENEVDLTEYIGIGDNKVLLTITHATGAIATKSWTIKVVDVRLESNFNSNRTYVAGSTVEFTFIPYGSVDKIVHFKLDGNEIGTKESKSSAAGISDSYILPAQEHGSHLLEAWMTSDIANSKPIFMDIVWYDEKSEKPVIGCSTPKITVTQHDTKDIFFTIFDPRTETPSVIVEDNGEVIDTLTNISNGLNKYSYVATTTGSHEVVFVCRDERKIINVTVEELNIPVTPVTTSLAFDFNPVGYSNNSENRLWSYESEIENGTVAMTVSDNFDWINGGYQSDKDGSYFCIKAGTTATINYKMFCATKDIGSQGGHYKLVFKTTNVQDASQPFLKCYKNNVGVIMQPHKTNFYAGSGNKLYLPYSEDDTIEFELNMGEEILNSSDKMVMGYEDGVPTKPLVYTSGATFIQGIQDADAEYITLGSTSCDLYIYRFKAYRKALTSKEVMNNFITDARSASEMLKRYNRNNIYNEAVSDLNISTGYSESYIEHFAERCPDLRVIMISAPRFTNDKKDQVQGTIARQIYVNGREFKDNWTAYNIRHSGQGTSSNLYHAAGRNIDLIMNEVNDAGEEAWIEFADGTTLYGEDLKLNLTETSVPIDYLNIKLNIASSENANNAELARRYNKFNPYKRPLVREEGYPYEVKDTMEFYNCVVFIQETDTNQDVNGNYTQHMEFNDCNWHYYGLGNIGDSKKTDATRMNDPADVNEFVVEIMDNNLPNSKFQSGIEDEKGYSITGAAAKESWEACENGTFEKVYTEVTDSSYLIKENLPIFYELIDGEYVLTSDSTISPSKTYYELNYPNAAYAGMYIDKYFLNNKGKVEQEQGWAISFECRYEHDDSDHDEHIRIWNEFYKFVIFSSDEEFKAKIGDYCVLNSVMYYYLFTLRYTMIDNRAKNSFWHYGKCSDGKYRFDLTMDYDNDTALGINNLGEQVYRYGYEDFDYVDSEVSGGGSWVFNAATSTFYNRLRLLFGTELNNLYVELDGKGAWNAEDLIAQFDASQSQFPEEVWRQDIIRKYIRPYTTSHIDDEPDKTFLTNKMNGRKKYHRREFERNQSIYMASKYRTTSATTKIIRLRSMNMSGNLAVPVNLDLTIVPYMHMYVSVDYANGVITRQYRAKAGEPVVVDYPLDYGDIVAIESAPYIQSIGDISPFYTGEATLTTATRLKEVLLGNPTEGYSNPNLPNIMMVEDGLVEVINIENIPSLVGDLDVSTLRKLKTVLAKGSNIAGLTLAKNCAAETLSLPSLSSLLSMRNLVYLKDIDIDSLESLERLIIEDCDFSTIENFVIGSKVYETPNELTFLDNAPNLQRVRLTGINWNLSDTSVLERLYSSSIGGYNASGTPTTRAYISGKVYVPSINEYDKKKYEELWSDLVIEGIVVPQFPVVFKNYNGEILDTQYIIKGQYPVDPVTREKDPIAIPEREPDIDKIYTYFDWDFGEGRDGFIPVLEPMTYYATYTSEVRCYTVKYVQPDEFRLSNPVLKEILNAPYGSYVHYDGETPTYTDLEENAYTYYLFKGWDKSGRVTGDKIITAEYDCCEYNSGYFSNLEIGDMRPVEIYALTRLVRQGQLTLDTNADGSDYTGIIGTNINQYDEFGFSMGYDLDYNDVESKVLIGKGAEDESCISPKVFSGVKGSYYDTGISLFDIDRSFVLAVDYEFASGNNSEATLMQCYDVDTDGFKLYYNGSSPSVMWFNNSDVCASGTNREMIVIRHKAGETGANVYISNLTDSSIGYIDFTKEGSRIPITDSTLVFGCNKEVSEDGTTYKNYAKGTIHWAKVWYDDLGDETCRKLASYIHEDVYTHLCGFRRHYISGTKSTPVLSFLGARALYGKKAMNTSSGVGNSGGWANSSLNAWLNNRFYNGIPSDIKQLIKQVTISSTAGSKSTELIESDCYIYIPAYADLADTTSVSNGSVLKKEISPPGSLISYMTEPSSRIRKNYDDSAVIEYYTRSPGLQFSSYFYRVTADGNMQETGYAMTTPMGVVISFSI